MGTGSSARSPSSTVSEKTKVATRTDSTTWMTQSRANSRSSRGLNCWLASCSATTTSEKVRLVTVMADVARTCSRVLAVS